MYFSFSNSSDESGSGSGSESGSGSDSGSDSSKKSTKSETSITLGKKSGSDESNVDVSDANSDDVTVDRKEEKPARQVPKFEDTDSQDTQGSNRCGRKTSLIELKQVNI